MYAAKLLPAALVAMGATLVAAQSGSLCSQPTITINSAAEATNIDCQTIEGSVKIAEDVTGEIALNGPASIRGDLIVTNATNLISLSSRTIGSISGKFTMQGLTLLSTLSFTALQTVGEISWITLPALSTLTFGTVGVTRVRTIRVSDTFLSSLDGLNVASVDSFTIDNNRRLVTYTTTLSNVTSLLAITANGNDLTFTAPRLVWARNIEVQNVGSIELPALRVVNDSIKFDNNDFTSFSAPNLTQTTNGDISFINNAKLNNLTMGALTRTGGGFTIQNNTALEKINGFPLLRQVGGAVKLRGNFTEISLPALDDVKGAFDVSSTKDISASCQPFRTKAPSRQGGNGHFQGTFTCDSNNARANEGGTTSGGGSNNGSDGAAAMLGFNPVLLGMAVLGGLAGAL